MNQRLSSKVVTIVAAIIVVAVALFAADAMFSAKAKVAVANERVRVAEAARAEIVAQLDAQAGVNAQIAAQIEAIKAEAKAREAALQARLAAVQTATPVQLVDQGSEILGASDIVTDGSTVTMGIETYREVVKRLVDQQDYRTVKIPEWRDLESGYKAEIAGLKNTISLHEKQAVIDGGVIKDLRSVISGMKTQSTLSKLAWAAGGFAAGVLADKI